jgi:isovaleryl-CoA dehydrogenase
MISNFHHIRKYVKVEKLSRLTKVQLVHNISQSLDIFNPTEEHQSLRNMVKSFVEKKVDPQALEYNKHEKFNVDLFQELGELGLLGITVEPQYGGSGMDAVAAVIVHEELSASDPAFCLAYLAHSVLFVNNLAVNGTEEQKMKYLPG